MNDIKQCISSKFNIKDLGELHYILGIQMMKQDNGAWSMNQFNYTKKILQKCGFNECQSARTPIDPGVHLSISDSPKTSEEKEIMAKYPYRAVIGSLMFLATRTRPDILYTVIKLSQFIENPGYVH